jgi:hypothetical protein
MRSQGKKEHKIILAVLGQDGGAAHFRELIEGKECLLIKSMVDTICLLETHYGQP